MADNDIHIRTTADTSDLESKFLNACQAVQTSLDALRQSGQQATAGMGQLGPTAQKSLGAAKGATDSWSQSFAQLEHTAQNSLSGLILGTTTWQKTVQRLAQMALQDMINMAIGSATSWATQEGVKTAATETGVATRTATEASGQSAGLAQMAMSALKAIGTDAATAASGAYSSASQIPYVGWILGPIAAAAAFAAVMAFGGKIPSAAGGLWNVPSDTLAMVHKQETIIPAAIAQPMRDFFSGGAASGGGSSYAITIQAIDTQTGAQFLMNNAPLIAKSLAREMRNGNSVFRNAS